MNHVERSCLLYITATDVKEPLCERCRLRALSRTWDEAPPKRTPHRHLSGNSLPSSPPEGFSDELQQIHGPGDVNGEDCGILMYLWAIFALYCFVCVFCRHCFSTVMTECN